MSSLFVPTTHFRKFFRFSRQERIDLKEHAASFAENEVDGPLLVLLTADDLQLLGVTSQPEARWPGERALPWAAPRASSGGRAAPRRPPELAGGRGDRARASAALRAPAEATAPDFSLVRLRCH